MPAPLKLTRMRQAIARTTTHSFTTTPHYYVRTEFDATDALELRTTLAKEIRKAAGARVSLSDMMIYAMIKALRKHAFANRVWRDNTVWQQETVDVGIVVAVPDGLIIPIIHNAQAMDLTAMVRRRAEILDEVKSGHLHSSALQGGVTSLSNLGMTRADEFDAIIPPGHSSILAAGRPAMRPCVVGEQVLPRMTVKLSLAIDHRVMDGAQAADFLGTITDLLENPKTLIDEK